MHSILLFQGKSSCNDVFNILAHLLVPPPVKSKGDIDKFNYLKTLGGGTSSNTICGYWFWTVF